MMLLLRHGFLALALLSGTIAASGWYNRPPVNAAIPMEVFDRVVIPAQLQLLLAGGDRFLAANMENIRALASPSDSPEAAADNMLFVVRARGAVAKLNPCHEDNYYLANALMTWGGAFREGNEVLVAAAQCRFWDEIPPFLYGFNLYFFQGNVSGAVKALDDAADRSLVNSAPFRKLAIMIKAGSFQDDSLALSYLEGERDHAKDVKLRGMLDKRVARMRGLITLKNAQTSYEKRYNKPLTDPKMLLETGILKELPSDPLKIGYEFHEGRFRMREVKIAGLELPNK
ncbi:MAG: hypothetical protein H6R18_2654 [Proteobacteria bacterium]|nr:hypothetical protein [Pseudomonadota bacterium]